MTKEQAIEVIKAYRDKLTNSASNQLDGDIEAFEMAIQALSQEPTDKPMTVDEMEREYEKSKALFHKIVECDDAISRQSVFNAIEREDKWLLAAKGHNGLTEMAFSGLKGRIDALLPVMQKSGKWIRSLIYENTYNCSKCGSAGYDTFKYCPNCGAKMESEE